MLGWCHWDSTCCGAEAAQSGVVWNLPFLLWGVFGKLHRMAPEKDELVFFINGKKVGESLLFKNFVCVYLAVPGLHCSEVLLLHNHFSRHLTNLLPSQQLQSFNICTSKGNKHHSHLSNWCRLFRCLSPGFLSLQFPSCLLHFILAITL